MPPRRLVASMSRLGLFLALVSGCYPDEEPTNTASVAPPAAGDPVVVAAGDIVCPTATATAVRCRHAETAALIGQIAPMAVLLLGDIQYDHATLDAFNRFYHPTWGVYKAITWPAPGNHEYETPGAAGYFDYFNGVGAQSGRAGERGRGYYSFNLGAWHLVALNSNCESIGGCGPASAQEQWLRADLAANPATCTLAFWHHPRFSSGPHGSYTNMQALWQALYDYGADLVLAGHDHAYERFAPQTATGELDLTKGVRSFVVGTGGRSLRGFSTALPNSERRSRSAFGILKLTLRPDGYDWQFVPVPGQSLADAGSATCVGNGQAETRLTVYPDADTYVLESSPNRAFGSRITLEVDGSPTARTYLRLPVSGIGAKTVVSARLHLYAVNSSDVGGRLHRVPSTSWSEATVRWSNAPAYDAAVIATLGPVTANAWYEIDVTSEVDGDGTVSFVLESESTDGADYRSRESGASLRPRLMIVAR